MAAKVECPQSYHYEDGDVACASTFEAPTKVEVIRLLMAHIRESHPSSKTRSKERA